MLVEKVEPEYLEYGFVPLNDSIYPGAVLSYVRSNFKQIGETKYYEIRQ